MIRLMTDVRSLRVDLKKVDHNTVELFRQSGNYHHPRPFLYHETTQYIVHTCVCTFSGGKLHTQNR